MKLRWKFWKRGPLSTKRPEFRPRHPIQHDNPGVSMMEDENGTLQRDPPLDPKDYENCDP